MQEITDEYMQQERQKAKSYSIVILKDGPQKDLENRAKIVWEHGRRNFQLRAEGKLAIVCPVTDDSDVCGIGIFTTSVEETKQIMDGDPGVQAGVFVYEIHPCRSFAGDSLPF